MRTLSRSRAVGLTVGQLSPRMMNLFPTAKDKQEVGRWYSNLPEWRAEEEVDDSKKTYHSSSFCFALLS